MAGTTGDACRLSRGCGFVPPGLASTHTASGGGFHQRRGGCRDLALHHLRSYPPAQHIAAKWSHPSHPKRVHRCDPRPPNSGGDHCLVIWLLHRGISRIRNSGSHSRSLVGRTGVSGHGRSHGRNDHPKHAGLFRGRRNTYPDWRQQRSVRRCLNPSLRPTGRLCRLERLPLRHRIPGGSAPHHCRNPGTAVRACPHDPLLWQKPILGRGIARMALRPFGRFCHDRSLSGRRQIPGA